MKLKYRAKERNGTAAAGEIEAASLGEARARLRSQGLFIVSMEPFQLAGANLAKPGWSLFPRVKKADMVMMLSQLTIMCQSGVDLAEALQSVTTQCPKPALRMVMQRVSDDVTSGSTFADALRKHPQVFDEALVAGIAAGEQTGTLVQVLSRITQLLRGDMRLQSTVWSMLIYPLVLCAVTFVVLNALIFFVLPQFSKVFADLDKPAPPLTQFLLSIGDVVRGNIMIVIGSIIGLVVMAWIVRRSDWLVHAWDYATLHVAFVKSATRSLLTGRTFRLLGTMLASGVPLLDCIRLCRSAARNGLFRELFATIERDVVRGDGLGRALLASPFLPSGAAQMVVTAERTGKLGEVLQTVGEYFEDEGERYLRDVIKLLEPAVIVFLGIVVAGVVLAVILPLLDVSTVSH